MKTLQFWFWVLITICLAGCKSPAASTLAPDLSAASPAAPGISASASAPTLRVEPSPTLPPAATATPPPSPTPPPPSATPPPPSPTPTPFLPALALSIKLDNAGLVQPLASIGTGRNYNLRFSADSQHLAVDAGIGPLVYHLASLSPADPALFAAVFPGGPERWLDGQGTRIFTRQGEAIVTVWNTVGNYDQGLSADGSLLAAISSDPAQLEIWDLLNYTQQETWNPKSPGRIFTRRDFSSLGCGVNTGDGPGAGGDSFTLLAIHPAQPEPFLAGVCNNQRLLFFNAGGGLSGELPLPPDSTLNVMAFSPDGSQLAGLVSSSGPSQAQRVLVWSVSPARLLLELPLPVKDPFGWPLPVLALSPDNSWLALGLGDGRLLLWDLRSSAPAHLLQPASPYAAALAFSADGSTLAYSSLAAVTLFDLTAGAPSQTLDSNPESEIGGCGDLQYSADGRYLFCDAADSAVWDLGQPGAPAVALDDGTHFSFIADPPRLAGALANGVVLYAPPDWQAVETIPASNKFRRVFAFAPDAQRLALALYNQELVLLERGAKKWQELLTFEQVQATRLSFSPSGQMLAACTPFIEAETRAALSVFSLEKQQLAYRLRMEFPYQGDTYESATCAFAFSPDGSLLATGAGSQLKLYSAANGALLATLGGHNADILALHFSPDGRLIASFGAEGVIHLWGVPGK